MLSGTHDGATARLPASRTTNPKCLLRFAYLFFTLALALRAMFVLAFSPQFHLWWVETFQAPALQKEFGFTVEHQEIRLLSGAIHSLLVIDSLSAGGRFDRLGFKVGDAIVCLYHGPAEFWGELLLARDGYQATFRVLAAEGIAGGCEQARSITIRGRSLMGSARDPSAQHPLKQPVGATVFQQQTGLYSDHSRRPQLSFSLARSEL